MPNICPYFSSNFYTHGKKKKKAWLDIHIRILSAYLLKSLRQEPEVFLYHKWASNLKWERREFWSLTHSVPGLLSLKVETAIWTPVHEELDLR